MEQIKIPSDSGIHLVPISHIIRVQSMDNYSKVYFTSGKPLLVAKLLLWFEQRLPTASFTRIHRSHLVNCLYITGYRQAGPTSAVRLSNGEMITVSRRRRWIVEEAMPNLAVPSPTEPAIFGAAIPAPTVL